MVALVAVVAVAGTHRADTITGTNGNGRSIGKGGDAIAGLDGSDWLSGGPGYNVFERDRDARGTLVDCGRVF